MDTQLIASEIWRIEALFYYLNDQIEKNFTCRSKTFQAVESRIIEILERKDVFLNSLVNFNSTLDKFFENRWFFKSNKYA